MKLKSPSIVQTPKRKPQTISAVPSQQGSDLATDAALRQAPGQHLGLTVGPQCLSHNSQTTPTPSVKSVADM